MSHISVYVSARWVLLYSFSSSRPGARLAVHAQRGHALTATPLLALAITVFVASTKRIRWWQTRSRPRQQRRLPRGLCRLAEHPGLS
jgi:hypothetical protein